jgi:serine/threonine-protein kinase
MGATSPTLSALHGRFADTWPPDDLMGSPTSTKIPVGTLLSGKYKVTREIGRGGMAAVYEAENVDIGKRVAIKVLAQELTTSMVVVERFFREARAAAAIRSPYICDVYDSGRLDGGGPPFLVLELLEGESLYERMTKVRYFDVATTLAIVTQACRGLTKAHAANIVHRDLKPENIFLTKDEEGELLAKILDFGLAKFYTPLEGSGGPQQARLTREGAVFGTPAYMSPEQVRGQGAVDLRADLWALGCIVYECFTGRTVWQTEQGVAMTFAQIASAPVPDPLVFRPDLPQKFKLWFQKALDRRIDQRFQTAREFAEELAVALELGRPTSFSGMFGANELAQLTTAGKTVPAPPPSMPGVTAAALPESKLPQAPPDAAVPHAVTPRAGMPDGASPRATKAAFEAPPRVQEPRTQGAGIAQPVKKPNAAARVAIGAAAVALVGGAVYAGWSQLNRHGSTAPPNVAPSGSTSGSGSDPTRPPATTDVKAAHDAPSSSATLPWHPLVADAQAAIAKGEPKEAFKLLKDAFDKGGHGVPRTMLDHVQIAISEGGKSPCTLKGLGRPRTYDLAHAQARRVPSGRPAIAMGERGPVMVWADNHAGPEHAYAVLLDEAMRPLSAPIDVTPEGSAVSKPVLESVDGKLLLAYTDGRGPDAGVHARMLDPDGRIGGPQITVAPLRAPSSGVSIDRAPDGSFFVAWTAESETGHEDLYLRRVSAKLEPLGEVVRVTDVPMAGPQKPRARFPSIAVVGDALHLAFRLDRMPQHYVEHVRLPIADADKSLPPRDKSAGREERFVGESALMNKDRGKADAPSIACSKDACFFAWSRETGGNAHAAFINPAHAEPLWRNPFSARGSHPAVAFDDAGRAQMVWFERGGVMTTSINRDGVGKTVSKLARVSGDQPTPSVVAGKGAGEWFIAWLDFEAGYLEPYAARFVCR